MPPRYPAFVLPFILTGGLSAGACAIDRMDDDGEPGAAAQASRPAVINPEIVFTHGNGSTSSVHAPSGSALFTVASVTGQTVEDALIAWLRTGVHYGLGTASSIQLTEVRRSQFGALEVVHFDQDYRGVPLVGPAARVVVTLDGDDAISVTGRPIDAVPDYAGIQSRMTAQQAERPVRAAYRSAQPGASAPIITGMTLVAISSAQTLAWQAQVQEPGYDAMEIIVDAVAGTLIAQQILDYYSLDEERPVHLLVEEVGADPVTPGLVMAWDMPGALTNSCPDPEDDEDCLVRMGNMRLSVYDYQRDNAAIPLVMSMPITHLFNPGEPWSKFLYDPPSYGFNAQNLYHKAVLGTSAVDPHVSAIGWDHYPGTPWSDTEPSSLLLMVNVDGQTAVGPYCGTSPDDKGGLGLYGGYSFTDAEVPLVEPPHGTASLPRISICQNEEGTVFHELGHYYDAHLANGMMGQGIDRNNTCTPDTSDEAPALAETVADMFSAALYAKLYPSLAYDMGTTSTACKLGVMTLPGEVHGDGCAAPTHFDDQRPSSVKDGACNQSAGYNQNAVQQAWWEFLKGKTCSMTAPYDCATATTNPDNGIKALLYALTQGNGQSYKELVHNMAVWLLFNGSTDETARFVEAFSHHGLID